jgi:hypothetical protein
MTKVKSSKRSQRQNWMAVSKKLCNLDIDLNTTKRKDLNFVFANHREEEEIYPLATIGSRSTVERPRTEGQF